MFAIHRPHSPFRGYDALPGNCRSRSSTRGSIPVRAGPSACTIPTVADGPFIAARAPMNHTYTKVGALGHAVAIGLDAGEPDARQTAPSPRWSRKVRPSHASGTADGRPTRPERAAGWSARATPRQSADGGRRPRGRQPGGSRTTESNARALSHRPPPGRSCASRRVRTRAPPHPDLNLALLLFPKDASHRAASVRLRAIVASSFASPNATGYSAVDQKPPSPCRTASANPPQPAEAVPQSAIESSSKLGMEWVAEILWHL